VRLTLVGESKTYLSNMSTYETLRLVVSTTRQPPLDHGTKEVKLTSPRLLLAFTRWAMTSSGASNKSDTSYDCDLRLSRAAVRIFRGYLDAGFLFDGKRVGQSSAVQADQSLAEVLRAANVTLGGDCILSEDLLALDPYQFGRAVSAYSPRRFAARLALSPELYQQGRTRQNQQQQQRLQNPPQFYQCSLCGKAFVTRYYLDRHFEKNHLASDPSSAAGPRVCAADWCHEFLSLQACHDVALENEPYYGPGSGDHAPMSRASSKTKHAWFQRAHKLPCRDAEMQKTKARCHSVVQSCLPPNSTQSTRLEQQMCGALSCHHRLYRIFQKHSGMDTDWRNKLGDLALEWEAWNAHRHRWGIVGSIVLVLFVGVYAPCAIVHWIRQRRLRQQRNPFSTLPSRRTSSIRKSTARSNGSAFDPKKRL
jgi:hypothetical protein